MSTGLSIDPGTDPGPAARPTTRPAAERVIPCPFTVVVDTREQAPYTFENIYTGAPPRRARVAVPTARLALAAGDYSVLGTPGVAVERKSKADLYGSVARRANFAGRLERMAALAYAAVVVEADYLDCLNDPPPFTRFRPRSLSRTVIAWRQRYRVDWHFVGGRDAAEVLTFRILERFYLDHRHPGRRHPGHPDGHPNGHPGDDPSEAPRP